MRRPLTYPDAMLSPGGLLLVGLEHDAIHVEMTDGAAHVDCFDCQFYGIGDDAEGGEFCAMECAAMVGNAAPALARLFGWTECESQPGFYNAPLHCPWFVDRDAPAVPFDDPRQITIFESEAA